MSKFNFAGAVLFASLAFFSTQAQPPVPPQGKCAVSGVVTLKGKPARGVSVELVDQGLRIGKNYNYSSWLKTDEHGRFQITKVAAGKYWIHATAPGHFSAGYEGGDRSRMGGQLLDLRRRRKIENITIEIMRGGAITGRITDLRGKPVVDERILLFKIDKNGKPNGFNSEGANNLLTDDQGFYRLYGLPEGRYLVAAGHYARENGLYNERVFYPDAADESKAKVIEVTEESEVSGIDITLSDLKRFPEAKRPTGNIRFPPRNVTLRLETEDGTILPNVSFEMVPVTKDGVPISMRDANRIFGMTDENGGFKFHEENPNDERKFYLATFAESKGYTPRPSPENEGQDPLYSHISYTGDNMTIAMIKGGVISGRVTTANGEPIIGAVVFARMTHGVEINPDYTWRFNFIRPINNYAKITDDRGGYRFYGLKPGTYVVYTSSDLTNPFHFEITAFTYHPSSTRATAAEVIVSGGGEASGIDIRYHNGERRR